MSLLTPTTFRDAVLVGFGDTWAGLTEIAVPNKPFDPEGKSNYVQLRIIGDGGGSERFGGSTNPKIFRKRGLFQAQCFVQKDADTDFAYEMAERALTFLEKQNLSGVTWSAVTAPQEVGVDGPFFQVAVSAQWSYFSQRPD